MRAVHSAVSFDNEKCGSFSGGWAGSFNRSKSAFAANSLSRSKSAHRLKSSSWNATGGWSVSRSKSRNKRSYSLSRSGAL